MANTPFFCINLKQRPDRWAQVEYEAENVCIKLNRVEGITPTEVTNIPVPNTFRNAKEIACAQSHIKALETALKFVQDQDNKPEYVVVIEDDVVFVKDFTKQFEAALQSAPKNVSVLYLGYLRYKFSAEIDQSQTTTLWTKLKPVYGCHGYAIRVSELEFFGTFLKKCNQAVDDYITSQWTSYMVARQPLVYQRINTSSDVTVWQHVANPFNHHIQNPLKLKYLEFKVDAESKNKKLLHVLPGQRLFFTVPPGWRVKHWTYFDEVKEYIRFGKIVPIEFIVVYLHGGMALPQDLTIDLDRHFDFQNTIISPDRVVAKRGCTLLYDKINNIIQNFDPEHEGGRWGDLLPESEVAPYFS